MCLKSCRKLTDLALVRVGRGTAKEWSSNIHVTGAQMLTLSFSRSKIRFKAYKSRFWKNGKIPNIVLSSYFLALMPPVEYILNFCGKNLTKLFSSRLWPSILLTAYPDNTLLLILFFICLFTCC